MRWVLLFFLIIPPSMGLIKEIVENAKDTVANAKDTVENATENVAPLVKNVYNIITGGASFIGEELLTEKGLKVLLHGYGTDTFTGTERSGRAESCQFC